MNLILLIFTSLFILNAYSPKNLKNYSVKAQTDYLLTVYSKDTAKSCLSFGVVFSLIYCIVLAAHIHTIIFTFVMIYWIAQSFFETNIILQYIEEKKEHFIFNSVIYKTLSRIIDLCVYGYILYFLIIHW